MNWFKFYGQDYLTDPKMLSLTPVMRALWLTVLCLASSNDGTIRYVSEGKIMTLTGMMPLDEEWAENEGFLSRFQELGMLRIEGDTISLPNFNKRQSTQLSGAERAKKYRETHKKSDERNEPSRDDRTARIDKKRIDKNIYPTLAGSELLKNYNRIFKKELKSTVSWEKNLAEWLNVYSVSDLVRALELAKKDQFWGNVMTPEKLLRRKNPRGEDCDHIADLLSKVKKPNLAVTTSTNPTYNLPKPEDTVSPERIAELRGKMKGIL